MVSCALPVQPASLAPGSIMTADEPIPVASTIPLPKASRTKVFDAARSARSIARLDAILVGLLLLLAFVLALFAAPNTDFWMHLGAGKLLLQGQYQFGTDPFAHTTGDAVWVNHAWLFDLLAYLMYQTFGGASLVVAKALLLALLAGILVWVGQRKSGWWLSAVCAALAILAISRWFLVQPIGISYVLFALTFALLQRRSNAAHEEMPTVWQYWPLLLLFVLWVNVDSWFLLGPLTVAITGLGAHLDGNRSRARTLGAVFVLGLVVCLVNPHHFRAFMVPEQLGLSGAGWTLRVHPLFDGQFLSPLNQLYYRPDIGLNAAGMAYFALIVVGSFSFLVNRAGWRWQHMLLWTAMLLLSLLSVRAIAFFAVVAGPITAINFGEARARRAEVASFFGGRIWSLGGRTVCVLGGVALVISAWPGWLQALPPEPRSWNVEADASVERTAELLAQWRRAGTLGPEDRGFNTSMDVANYLAFFYSGERSFFDQRWALFSPDVAADFLTIRQGITGSRSDEADSNVSSDKWREVLRKRHVNHVILHDNKLARSAALFRRLSANSREWALLHLDGRTAVFGWLDPANPKSSETFAAMQLADLNQRAFHPAEADRAPSQWPGRDPDPQWWDRYLSSAPSRTPETDEATLLLSTFDDLRQVYFDRHLRLWTNAQIAGALTVASGGDATAATPLGQVLHSIMADYFLLNPRRMTTGGAALTSMQVNALQLMNEWFMQQDDAPMALPLMAIRAARRAIHNNPDDAYAYLALGEAYVRLSQQTRERMTIRRMAFLDRIRKVQAITAFNDALLLNPNLAQAHARLAEYYTDFRYGDLVLKHRKELLRLTIAAGPRPGEPTESYQSRRDELQKHVSQLDDDVREMLNVFEVNATNLKIVPRAQQAQGRGLGGKALDILKASDITAFGKIGLEMELELLLTTGGIREFRAWFDPVQHRPLLNEPSAPYACEWYLVYLAAASGNYDEADANLAAMDPSPSFRGQTLPLIGQAFLDVNPHGPAWLATLHAARIQERLRRQEAMWSLQQLYRADLTTVRGLLALERGDGERATALFREALATADAAAAASPGTKMEFSGRSITEACLELLAP
jgi:hypothetical protein